VDYWDWWVETGREIVAHGVMEMRKITIVPKP